MGGQISRLPCLRHEEEPEDVLHVLPQNTKQLLSKDGKASSRSEATDDAPCHSPRSEGGMSRGPEEAEPEAEAEPLFATSEAADAADAEPEGDLGGLAAGRELRTVNGWLAHELADLRSWAVRRTFIHMEGDGTGSWSSMKARRRCRSLPPSADVVLGMHSSTEPSSSSSATAAAPSRPSLPPAAAAATASAPLAGQRRIKSTLSLSAILSSPVSATTPVLPPMAMPPALLGHGASQSALPVPISITAKKTSSTTSSLSILTVGSHVEIEGLTRHPYFNGLCGVIESWDAKTGRYDVKLAEGAEKACGAPRAKVKGENLKARPAPRQSVAEGLALRSLKGATIASPSSISTEDDSTECASSSLASMPSTPRWEEEDVELLSSPSASTAPPLTPLRHGGVACEASPFRAQWDDPAQMLGTAGISPVPVLWQPQHGHQAMPPVVPPLPRLAAR
eukprot:TRINITY_DN11312_c0_g2_i1.p1 TRINITY_DN11312_c0_g2~~TRINITY_DN11312_c0_g2_i1.p1  ORF type:complete len:477 (+),score=104.69 TRINITY_DN11312_c0_g2_i1:79-1431(+)